MTTATPAASVTPTPAPARVRRAPRQPRFALFLLLLWLSLFVGGIAMFVYWIINEAAPGGQLRLGRNGAITVGVIFLSWPLLAWRARRLQALDRKVKGANGAVCLNCHTVLTHEGQEGACPRCGEAFTLAHNRDVWKKHTP